MDGLVLPDSVSLAGYMQDFIGTSLGGTTSANLSPTLEAFPNLLAT